VTSSVDSLLAFAVEIAYQAGRLTLGHFQTGLAVERKSDDSPVTVADRSAEAFLRKAITERFPDHGIVGEEYGVHESSGSLRWILDPIDGTKSFIHGVPLYSNLIGLVDDDLPPDRNVLVGVANFPALNETLYAARGEGAYWNGRPACVSSVDRLEDATVLFSDVKGYGKHRPAFDYLIQHSYIQRTWGDSYGYALVATGRADVMLDPAMHVWDCAPFGVIMAEAGGTFTDWNGVSTISAGESVATNGHLFNAVLRATAG
jgi:histidinol phosphatase-like enzyme (inositol monophosphatase family)